MPGTLCFEGVICDLDSGCGGELGRLGVLICRSSKSGRLEGVENENLGT